MPQAFHFGYFLLYQPVLLSITNIAGQKCVLSRGSLNGMVV